VNLNQNEKELPPGAASLKEFSKKEIDLENFLRELLQQLDRYYSVFKKDKSAIIQEWKSCTNMWGKTVKIKTADKEIHGQAIDLDERGALIIRLDNGFMEKVLSGDVVI
jgi:BirA family biotin operon repressor/biotin-[acetyl-CoA-carboxylase] ligase